jgi:mono/diheme cytochrome c family protein
MRKRLLISVIALGVLGILGFGALAWRPAIAPIAAPASGAFAPELVAKGAALAAGGYCAECHTTRGGRNLPAAMRWRPRSAYSTRPISRPIPRRASAPGRMPPLHAPCAKAWRATARFSIPPSLRPFQQAFRRGCASALCLFQALYAFFMTRAPVRAPAHKNGLPFPLNIRYLQAGWRLLFFRPGRFEPDASKSAEWNRGAYLAEGLSHCGVCQTPRNLLGAEEAGAAYAEPWSTTGSRRP